MTTRTSSDAANRSPRTTDALLAAAIAVPFLYWATVLVASWFYPGYSHVTQYASELGSPTAPHPSIFNVPIFLSSFVGLAGAIGVFRALRELGIGSVKAWLVLITMGSYAAMMFFGGLFPMPDERHGGYGIGLLVQLAPLMLAIAIWKTPGAGALKGVLVANTLAICALFAIMMGVGGLVTYDNVGLWQRAYGLTMTPWMAYAALVLMRIRRVRAAP